MIQESVGSAASGRQYGQGGHGIKRIWGDGRAVGLAGAIAYSKWAAAALGIIQTHQNTAGHQVACQATSYEHSTGGQVRCGAPKEPRPKRWNPEDKLVDDHHHYHSCRKACQAVLHFPILLEL